MTQYRCLFKNRNKHGLILGYRLVNIENGQDIYVTPRELKDAIIENRVSVTNLKLTSDGKLIDSEEIPEILSGEVRNSVAPLNTVEEELVIPELKEYETQNNKGIISYLGRKLKGKRVGKKIAMALAIGLLVAPMTACITPQPINGTIVDMEYEPTHTETRYTTGAGISLSGNGYNVGRSELKVVTVPAEYKIVVEDAEGKQHTVSVSSEEYHSFSIGDNYSDGTTE